MERLTGNWYNRNGLEKTPIFSNPNQILSMMVKAMTADNSTFKTCKQCNQVKSLTSFPQTKNAQSKYYRENTCGVCKKQRHRKQNPERYLELRRLQNFRARARKLGISLEEYLTQRGQRKTKAQSNKSKLKVKKCQHSKCPILRHNPKIDYRVNKEKVLARCKDYYYRNLDKAKMKTRNYRHNHRAAKAAEARRYHELKSKGKVTAQQWRELKECFDNRCAYCLRQTALTQDHFEPLSKGGLHDIENIIPCCRSCNSSKTNKSYVVWLAARQGRR
jgi:hypothetical protein